MNDQVLTILKGCLIALLYLFLARVIWVVNRELRGTPAPVAPEVRPPRASAATTKEPKRARGWRLDVVEPAAQHGRSFPISTEITIGRGAGCAISFPDDTFVSTLHTRVFLNDDAVWIEDLGSTNGTMVNGSAITQPTRLRKGDRLGIGSAAFEVSR